VPTSFWSNPLEQTKADQAWSADFMSGALADKRTFLAFKMIDVYSLEKPQIEVDISFTAETVT